MTEDPLATARGCLLALVITLVFWLFIGGLVWIFVSVFL